ncbi:GAF and ANTAR domain-containing protein [Nocardia jejuensis]|uniref:GAF and ANTAR domain-containing protein n=1 Tax=Nocardia jejuensis TaxID=328049 RepID=UPI001FE0DCC5|nr:GAF and ANTAR domain-containing protein [Nocardia jejuensis]
MLPGDLMVGVAVAHEDWAEVGGSAGVRTMLSEEPGHNGRAHPSAQVIDTMHGIAIPDLSVERRWGGYSARMLDHGIQSVVVQPLPMEGKAIGTLSLYAADTDGISEQAGRAAVLTAEHIGTLLAAGIGIARTAALTTQLRATLVSRSCIDQALGVIMGRRRCPREDAFAMLREMSQRRNIKVADLAAEIIEGVTGTKPLAPHFIES